MEVIKTSVDKDGTASVLRRIQHLPKIAWEVRITDTCKGFIFKTVPSNVSVTTPFNLDHRIAVSEATVVVLIKKVHFEGVEIV